MNKIPNRLLSLYLSEVPRRSRFTTFLIVSLAAGLIAVTIGMLLSVSQTCTSPTTASNVASTTAGAIEERPYLGITYVPITAHMASYYELSTNSGVLVTAVAPGSPAQKAGIQPDDIITEFDGLVLSNEITIVDILNQRENGQGVEVSIERNGERSKIGIALGPRRRN